MALKNYNPTSHKGKPVKALTEGKRKSGGRNNKGRRHLARHRGGHKQSYRIIDFKRRKFDMPATVERLEYDPNRTAFIALIKYEDGEQAYILAPQRLAVGDKVIAGEKVDVKPGNAMPLGHAGRHDRPQRRDEAGQGRPDRPFGRHLRPARRP
jgi:large subunit ribosomal protein L2